MTQIHGSAPPRDRLDDSAVLQKRLLQDLERQWLDTWGQARQLQAQAGSQLDASNAVADAGLAGSAAGSAPRPGMGQGVARGDGLADGSHAASATAAGEQGGARLSKVGLAEQTQALDGPRGITPNAAETVKRARPAIAGPDLGRVDGAAAGARTEAAASAPLAGAFDPAGHGLDVAALQINALAGAVLASASGWGAQAAGSGAPADQALVTPTAASTATEPAHLALSGKASSPLPGSAGDGEAEASASARRRFSAASPDTEPASQHLMLRELNEQEVLASMRDVQLGSLESQVAAQELARALMQAGYARVQVVVNGHQRNHGDVVTEDGRAGDTNPSVEPTPNPISNIQATHHGN